MQVAGGSRQFWTMKPTKHFKFLWSSPKVYCLLRSCNLLEAGLSSELVLVDKAHCAQPDCFPLRSSAQSSETANPAAADCGPARRIMHHVLALLQVSPSRKVVSCTTGGDALTSKVGTSETSAGNTGDGCKTTIQTGDVDVAAVDYGGGFLLRTSSGKNTLIKVYRAAAFTVFGEIIYIGMSMETMWGISKDSPQLDGVGCWVIGRHLGLSILKTVLLLSRSTEY